MGASQVEVSDQRPRLERPFGEHLIQAMSKRPLAQQPIAYAEFSTPAICLRDAPGPTMVEISPPTSPPVQTSGEPPGPSARRDLCWLLVLDQTSSGEGGIDDPMVEAGRWRGVPLCSQVRVSPVSVRVAVLRPAAFTEVNPG